jgi:phosphoserine phosphatase
MIRPPERVISVLYILAHFALEVNLSTHFETNTKKDDDLIISASPTCIIEPIAKRLGVNYMATEYDREFGVFLNTTTKKWMMWE